MDLLDRLTVDTQQLQYFDLGFEQVIFKTVSPSELYSVLHALPNIHQYFGISAPEFKSCDFVLVYFWSDKCGLWNQYSPLLGKYFHELYAGQRNYSPLILFCDIYKHPEFTKMFQLPSDGLITLRNSPVAFVVKKFDFSTVQLPQNVSIHPIVFLQTMIGCVNPKAIDELINDTKRFTVQDLLTSQLVKDYVQSKSTIEFTT